MKEFFSNNDKRRNEEGRKPERRKDKGGRNTEFERRHQAGRVADQVPSYCLCALTLVHSGWGGCCRPACSTQSWSTQYTVQYTVIQRLLSSCLQYIVRDTDTIFVLTATPFVLTDNPFLLTDTPFLLTDTPFVLTDTPFALTDNPFLLTDTPFELTDTPFVLTDTPFVLTDTPSVLYPYWDERRDTRSNIPLRLKKFPRAKPEGTLEGGGMYLTVYPELSPNTDSISFYQILG